MSLNDVMTPLMDKARKLTGLTDKISIARLTELMDHFDLHVNPNLYEGAKDFSGNWGYSIGVDKDHPGDHGWYKDGIYNGYQVASHSDEIYGGLYQYHQAKPGEQYTFSFYAKYSTDNDNAQIAYDDTSSTPVTYIHLTTEWQHFAYTFTVADGVTSIDPRVNSGIGKGTLSICAIKLEKGDQATPLEKVGGN